MPELGDVQIAASAPHGMRVTLADLPPPEPRPRWVARRKAQVVAAVEAGLLSLDEARRRYLLSAEEFFGWQRALHQSGLKGLRIVAGKMRRTKKSPRSKRPETVLRGSGNGEGEGGAQCS